MGDIYTTLASSALLEGISTREFDQLLCCLNPRAEHFRKGAVIHRQGQPVSELGLILSGGIEAARVLPDGRTLIQAVMETGGLFGEALASTGSRPSPVQVSARWDSEILFFSHRRIVSVCSQACPCHIRLIENMLRLLADKYFALNSRMDYLMRKGMREKIACYLLERRQELAQDTFALELNRQELADYLNVDRSALSRELSRMKEEGLIDYDRSSFRLLDPEGLIRAAAPD